MLYSPGWLALTRARYSSPPPKVPSTTLMPVFSVKGVKAYFWKASETTPPQPSKRTWSTAASAWRANGICTP